MSYTEEMKEATKEVMNKNLPAPWVWIEISSRNVAGTITVYEAHVGRNYKTSWLKGSLIIIFSPLPLF
jgi:hypothetical protein